MGSSSYLGAIGAGEEHDFTGYYVFPASSAQKRLWFLCQLEPESNAAYNVTSAVRLTGELNRLRLQQAVDAVVARHESLRTGIGLVGGEPRQVVAPSALVALPMIDCAGLDPASRDARLRQAATEETARAFVLHEPPLVRMVLLRMATDEHVLIVTVHHTVCDGWSMELFFRDLAGAYLGGEQPEPQIQYADYVVWQDERLAERMDTLLSYWRPQLAGVAALDLPTDRPRPPVRTVRGAVRTAAIPADLVERLTRLGQRHDATLFMVLLAAFKLLLARLSGQRDIAVGTPVAGREHPDAEEVIGFFANTLVLRGDIDVDAAFADVLGTVRSTCLDAFSHREMPFDRLVEELRPPRNLSRTPLFQVMFALQTTPGVALRLPELSVEPVELNDGSAKFDLWLTGVPTDSGITLRLEYNTDLFDDQTAERLLAEYLGTLPGIAEHPDRPLARPAEGGEPPGHWTHGPSRALAASLPELLAAQAKRTPSAVAMDGLTLGDLCERANSLAHELPGAGAVVAVQLPRTPELAVALLAVMTAGAAVLPLDPDLPEERVQAILADAKPAAMLRMVEPAESHRAPAESPAPDDLAVIVYPHGTVEGGPVRLPHRALVGAITALQDGIEVTGDDVVAAVGDLGSTLGVLELFLAPAAGGRTALGPEPDSTVLLGRAATWRALLATDWLPGAGMRVACLGEPFDLGLTERLRAAGARVWRSPGPVDLAACAGAERPPANVSRQVLDGQQRPVPVGTAGELYLDGYRTGIRCRYTGGGELEVMGPADGRIALRDHWIDPEIIEAALARHDQVAEAAVVGGEFGDETQLVCWLVRADAAGPAIPDAELVRRVRADAGRRLPEHLVPPVFGVLDELPTRDGTVDRRTLRGRQADAVFGSADRTPPRNRTERVIAELFAELLEIAAPGVHANFFGLGGYSLLAAKVIARVRADFGVQVPVREFFKLPTAAGLAAAVGAEADGKPARSATGDAVAGMSDDEVTRLLSRMR